LLARARVDALDPQGAAIPLLGAPVAVGILQALLDLLDGHAVDVVAPGAVALGTLPHLFVPGVGAPPPLRSFPGPFPLLRVDQEVPAPSLGIGPPPFAVPP